ncbi:MAG: AhpC/TSA family protein [Myxococcaceae bacterium]|nr:AhpC/TSA family protein [Myxococcaceae bacterium]
MKLVADTAALGALEVTTTDGQPVAVGSAWEKGPALLVWLRHFGCLFCREQVKDFMKHQAALEAKGIALRFIGIGTPLMAKDFQETYRVTAPVWVDKGRRTYALLQFKNGWDTVLNARTVLGSLRALSKGQIQGRTSGRPDQQGGVLVVSPGGKVEYGYASEVAGDHPPVDDVLRAAYAAAAPVRQAG